MYTDSLGGPATKTLIVHVFFYAAQFYSSISELPVESGKTFYTKQLLV